MSTPYEWRIADIERAANEAKSRLWQIDDLKHDVCNLEGRVNELTRELQQARSENESIQIRLSRLEEHTGVQI
jgi:predicted  nucleic acid-binding Zn-ribbon protein